MSAIIMVIDGDRGMGSIFESLQQIGYEMHRVINPDILVQECLRVRPDLVIMPWGIGETTGTELCDRIRDRRIIKDPFLMLVPKQSNATLRTVAYSAGCDDILLKPYSNEELVLRVYALLRRSSKALGCADEILTGHLRIDVRRREVYVRPNPRSLQNEQLCELTYMEYNLLKTLAGGITGQVWSRGHLLETVWEEPDDLDERVVDSFIKRIRKKLCQSQLRKQIILTRVGVGYFFDDPRMEESTKPQPYSSAKNLRIAR